MQPILEINKNMVRRKQQNSILAMALRNNWEFTFTIAFVALLVTIFLPSVITNPFLKPIVNALKPLGYVLAGVFAAIAGFKFILENKTKRVERSSIRHEPIVTANNTQDNQIPASLVKQLPTIERPSSWSLNLLKSLEWKRYEDLAVAYYREKGYEAEATSLGADGGIDIKLYQDESDKPTTIVQCKAWGSQVGVKQIREFLGVMTHEKIQKGFYMTTSSYTADAIEFAKTNKITLITGDMLLMMLQRLSSETQLKLLTLVTDGDYKTPTCASCGVKMLRRPSKRGDFWGCVNYPRCRQTLKLRSTDKQMRFKIIHNNHDLH